MDKSFTLGDLEALIGRQSIIAVQGDEWKTLRKRFNPGFAPQHLMTLLPCILERSQRFIDIIDGFAKSGEEFRLAEPCANLTFDIIGAVTMDEDFFAQSNEDKQSEIYKSFLELAATYPKGGGIDLDWLNVFSRLKRRSLTRKLDSLLQDHIKKKFAELVSSSLNKSRSILSLSLQGVDKLDQRYLDQTSDQLKTFLFAGYDTTSIVLQWAFYELSRTPHALHAIREEMNATFGQDASPSAIHNMLLSRGDELIGKMTYTSAVIKEVLRLHPPSGSARYTPKGTGYNVQTPGGETICLDGMIVYNCETIIQRDEMIFGETKDAFVPERWIGNSDTSIETNTNKQVGTRIPPSAWRPFERGPRNCIGQELANLEFRVVLACTIRRYNFTKVGLGELARSTHGELVMGSHGQYTTKSELFNTMQVTAKPEDGTRMRVAFTR
ncbi:hypothetical protein ZTR_04763 [Talaromyces verruculosus]|nr:hypothetical protein ZTR_04763 [Talaromyces verruculosus]